MSDIKVSIIVPIYNTEKYIEKCLESLVNQTLKEVEIILIDDFSTDNSSIVYSKYLSKYDNIKLIKNDKNIGVSASRNKGINLASGEFIGFVDSDDWVDVSMYEKLYKLCVENSSDISMCGMVEVYTNTRKFIGNKLNCTLDYKNDALEKFFRFEILAYSCNKLFKTNLIKGKNIYYPNLRFAEDQYTTFLSLYYSNKVSLIDECLYFYNKHEDSVTNSKFIDSRLDLFDVMENIKTFMIERKIFDKYKYLYQYRYINVIIGNIFDVIIDNSDKYVDFKYNYKKIKYNLILLTRGYLKNDILSIKLKIKISLLLTLPYFYYFIFKK